MYNKILPIFGLRHPAQWFCKGQMWGMRRVASESPSGRLPAKKSWRAFRTDISSSAYPKSCDGISSMTESCSPISAVAAGKPWKKSSRKPCRKRTLFPGRLSPYRPSVIFLDGKEEKVFNALERLVTICCQPQHIEVRHSLSHQVVGEGYVHDGWIADPPKIVNTARSIINFSIEKSSRWLIGKHDFWVNSLKRSRPDVVVSENEWNGKFNHPRMWYVALIT